jgi:AcrR family transcriptional regulator
MTGARMSKGEATRQRLLDAAQRSILEKGFTATSIDELIAECGLTKGGFFYHFKDKTDLAKALLQRYIARHHAETHVPYHPPCPAQGPSGLASDGHHKRTRRQT